jgi:hypothetical protein
MEVGPRLVMHLTKVFFSQSVSSFAENFWAGWSDQQCPDGTVV